jgi:DNA-binding NarL/FixJ family response regulator
MSDGKKSIRVLLVEDEAFTRTMIAELLKTSGYLTQSVNSVAEAIIQLNEFDPHVVATDLNLGKGPDGADLLNKVATERPWTGMVVVTAHSSPHLAISDAKRIPENTIYIVKSQISSAQELIKAIEESIKKNNYLINFTSEIESSITITPNQAEILKMLAEGMSNNAIAESRGITLRAAEALIQRTFAALGVNNDSQINARVAAVKLWHEGKVVVK